jgi:OOP family OmpA-OmpF porin
MEKRMKLRSVLLAATMLSLPIAAAHAQAIDGPYVAGGAGVNFLQNQNPRLGVPGGALTANSQSAVGPSVVLSTGWGFGNGFRAELEGDYLRNATTTPNGGELKAGAMANIIYDFVGLVPVVQPYFGVGAGYQWAFEQQPHGTGPGFSYSGPTRANGGFAYQAILGASYPIAAVPGLAITAEYRFLGLEGSRSYGVEVTPVAGTPVHGSLTPTKDFNHSILIGMRYAFGTAPAPAPAVTPVADLGAKTFLVFFDWDKYDLTDRGAGIVHEAASYSQGNRYTRIDVDGNTDTSGTPQYNQGLSERRARTVAGELVRDGVPQNAISMHAYGDTKLLVPTGPGVREPQNRRVEIVFH